MLNLQFITHCTARYSYFESACMALKGGCKWIQLRMKDAPEEEVLETAARLLPLCRVHQATFILDDHVELIKPSGADGVHLGKNDMPIREARRLLGSTHIIGGTANTLEELFAHYKNGADYIGLGPFRFTTTKTKLSPVLGLEGYRSILSAIEEKGVDIPVIAIGGIEYKDIPGLLEAGVSGIALSGTILNADDPVEETRKIVNYRK